MTRFTRCIVHAGTHKTGTTTVQAILAAHRAELAAAGDFYPLDGSEGLDHNSVAHKLATCADGKLPTLRRRLVGRTARAGVRLGDEARLVLSAEEFSTRICHPHPWDGFSDGDYWAQRRHYLSRLRQVLPEAAAVEVFVCFRDHESYAQTLYATKVVRGQVGCGFAEFVARCAPIFDYGRQADVLAQTLGPVRAERFDRLRGDLANRTFAWLGVPLRVEHSERLKATPSFDLIHWLARSVQTPQGRSEHEPRAAFCKAYDSPPDAGKTFDTLWSSAAERQAFLRSCRPPPIEGWPEPDAAGRIADAAALARRAGEIEAEYQEWLQRDAGGGQPRTPFWRRR